MFSYHDLSAVAAPRSLRIGSCWAGLVLLLFMQLKLLQRSWGMKSPNRSFRTDSVERDDKSVLLSSPEAVTPSKSKSNKKGSYIKSSSQRSNSVHRRRRERDKAKEHSTTAGEDKKKGKESVSEEEAKKKASDNSSVRSKKQSNRNQTSKSSGRRRKSSSRKGSRILTAKKNAQPPCCSTSPTTPFNDPTALDTNPLPTSPALLPSPSSFASPTSSGSSSAASPELNSTDPGAPTGSSVQGLTFGTKEAQPGIYAYADERATGADLLAAVQSFGGHQVEGLVSLREIDTVFQVGVDEAGKCKPEEETNIVFFFSLSL